MTWRQEAVFIGSAVVIGLVTMFMFLVRLVYGEDVSEGAASEGAARFNVQSCCHL